MQQHRGSRSEVQEPITIGLRKPTLGARVLHISINNRAWLHDAMIKPLKAGSKKNG